MNSTINIENGVHMHSRDSIATAKASVEGSGTVAGVAEKAWKCLMLRG